jgi:Cu(I)/Ag(I) efflux system membrane fusion protein
VARSEREGAAQSRFTLTSPIAGVVGELGTREGAMVQPGMALFRIVDLSSVWVETNVPEAQAAHVRVGAAAEVKAEAYPGRAFAGKVGAILPQVDATTRTLRARIELRNPGTVLKPGMFVSVSLRSGDSGDVLLVPQEAVITTGKRTVVIVAGDNNRFIPAEVTLGHAAGSAIEVRTGLAEGQRVVTSGQFLIDSEASLKSTLSRLDAGTSVVAQGTSAAAPATHRSEGRVEKIGKEELTVSHEPIPALKWPSMTMGFKHPAAGLPPGLRVGDRVRFEFVERKGGYQLTNVERIPGPGNKP